MMGRDGLVGRVGWWAWAGRDGCTDDGQGWAGGRGGLVGMGRQGYGCTGGQAGQADGRAGVSAHAHGCKP